MVNKLCANLEIPSGQCKLFDPKGCWDGFVFNSNGHCNYPFILKPKKNTCEHFTAAALANEETEEGKNVKA